MQARRLKIIIIRKKKKKKKKARSCGDNICPELLTQNVDMELITNNQIQHNSGQEPAASVKEEGVI
jgi:hypothetical protein